MNVRSYDLCMNGADVYNLIKIAPYRLCSTRSNEEHVEEFSKFFPDVKCEEIIVINVCENGLTYALVYPFNEHWQTYAMNDERIAILERARKLKAFY